MLTDSQYETARRELDELDAWVDAKRGRNGWASYHQEDVPAHLQHVDNELRGAVEYYEWMRDKPRKYFIYVNEQARLATTWNGVMLGAVMFGREYRGNMGDVRVPITVRGLNGLSYRGTYYKSAGDYARITAHVGQD